MSQTILASNDLKKRLLFPRRSIMMPAKRILLVSDSLGTPIHARGIFNFTCSLVQIIKKLGHKIVLLVEPPSAGLIPQLTQSDLERTSSLGTRRAVLSDIIRHFEGERFRFDWGYSDPSTQRIAIELPDVANFRLAFEDTKNSKKQVYIDLIQEEQHEFSFSNCSIHLTLFDGLLFHSDVYRESFRRGYHNLRPVGIDANGFDYIVIDTPHYIQFGGIEPNNILYVIHDFIPLYDSEMGYDWRQLFARKLECTITVARNVICNSETTKKYFEKFYGNNLIAKSIVIYPPIREEVAQAAITVDRQQPSNYIKDIQENKDKEQIEWAQKIREKTPLTQKSWLPHFGASPKFNFPKWDPDLPFFCSILSDEPRKNISALVHASRSFVGKANFLIMGQINGNAYMKDCPENFPNLHFTGYVSDVQKFDLLRSCKAFIFPSLREGFGIPIVEAALFGAPIICTDIPVFREITCNRAVYFDPHDPESLVRLIQRTLDDPEPEAMSLELPKWVSSSFNQDLMAKRLASLLS